MPSSGNSCSLDLPAVPGRELLEVAVLGRVVRDKAEAGRGGTLGTHISSRDAFPGGALLGLRCVFPLTGLVLDDSGCASISERVRGTGT